MHDLNKQLMESVAARDVQVVRHCLEKGADPNYNDDTFGYGDETIHQPNTPLKLVLFCISDNLLTDEDLGKLKEIARLLLSYKADPAPASELARIRYGKYNPNAESSAFNKVWRLVEELSE